MPTRASVADIARAAKVSTATVDRVLNRRPGVRDATAQRVLKAAGVVHGERHGREVVYRLVDEHLSHIVVDAVAHAEELR